MDEYHWMDLAEEAYHLREALVSRETIDEAKGMIMALRGCDSEAAFNELRHASTNHNIKLKTLANALVTCAGVDRNAVREAAGEMVLVSVVFNEWLRFMPVRGQTEPEEPIYPAAAGREAKRV